MWPVWAACFLIGLDAMPPSKVRTVTCTSLPQIGEHRCECVCGRNTSQVPLTLPVTISIIFANRSKGVEPQTARAAQVLPSQAIST